MKISVITTFSLLLFFSFANPTFARSGCCSHHNGVCGCGCCDGTPLSDTCAPYYPGCSQPVYYAPNPTTAPVFYLPTPTPTPKPTSTETPTGIPTTPQFKGESTSFATQPTSSESSVATILTGVTAVGISHWVWKKIKGKSTVVQIKSDTPNNEKTKK